MASSQRTGSFPFVVIDNPEGHVGKRVHVEGWNKGAVFILESFEDGVSTLKTPSRNKIYTTRNKLLYTRIQQYALEAEQEAV